MAHTRMAWNGSYEIGMEDIDFQHHFFLNLINRLAGQLLVTQDLDYRNALISELNAYAKFHFLSEENMMRREHYPLLEEHRNHHRELVNQLSVKQNMLLLEDSEQAAGDVLDFLVAWFLSHTTHEDRLFADFVHAKQNGSD
jgi:hemerythrin